MKNRYPSHIDRFTTILTLGISAAIMVAIVTIFFSGAADVPAIARGVPLVILAGFVALYCASIKAVVVTDSAIIVERKFGERVYPLSEIAEVRPISDELNMSLRLFGNGGIFGYMGWFRSSAIGTYQANANRRDARILLTFKDEKQLVLSADQSIDLSADIANRLKTTN